MTDTTSEPIEPTSAPGRLGFLAPGTPRLLSAALLALFVAALEQTIVGPVLPDILDRLGGGALLGWIATGYLVAATVAAPLYGAIADLRGRRQALLIANGLFLAGSVLCALAPSLPLLVLARLVQGFGAGGMVALPFIIIADRVPMSKRAGYSAYISTIYAVAGLIGPLLGGLVAERLSYTVVFWLNLPACAAVAWGVMTALAPRAATRGRRIDWPGAAFLLLATVPTLVLIDGIAGAQLLPGWGPVLSVLGLIGWIAFGLRMARAGDPLIPLTVFRNRTILLAALSLSTCQAVNIGLAVYLPLYYHAAFGFSPALAGAALLALVGGIMIGAYAPPVLLRRNPAYKPLLIRAALTGTALAAGFTALVALAPAPGPVIASTFGLGLSIGMLYPVFTLAVQNAAEPGQMGAAIGVLAFMRSIGGTLGVSLMGLAALNAGLAGEPATLPLWSLPAAACALMAVGLAANLMMPARRLKGFR